MMIIKDWGLNINITFNHLETVVPIHVEDWGWWFAKFSQKWPILIFGGMQI